MALTWVVSREVAISAAPKSVIFTSVPSRYRMFAGLMSRCVTPSLCANSSAREHLNTISTTWSTGSSASGPREALERAAVDVLHDDVGQLLVGHRVVDLADVRMRSLPASEASVRNSLR